MKSKVKEIFIMRAFACASVVFLHSIALIQSTYELSPTSHGLFRTLQLLVLYSTPMFVFISEFVLSYSYKAQLPKGFFIKRFKYILIPYIFFGIFYTGLWAYSYSITDTVEILRQVFLYVFRGDYHGYFVLIIFQFYLLHKIFAPLLNKWSMKASIAIAFIFNVLYLTFFNYTVWTDYTHIPFSKYLWSRGYFMIFPAWIFYFVLAYYAGQNMDSFFKIIKKYAWSLLPLAALFALVILYQYKYQLLTVISTKRPDIVPYTFMMILLVLYVASWFNKVPKGVDLINRCSYSIYLIHPFVQHILLNIMLKQKISSNPYVAFVLVFLISIYIPVLATILINKWRFGYLLVGKLGPSGIDKAQIPLRTKWYLPPFKGFKKQAALESSKEEKAASEN